MSEITFCHGLFLRTYYNLHIFSCNPPLSFKIFNKNAKNMNYLSIFVHIE